MRLFFRLIDIAMETDDNTQAAAAVVAFIAILMIYGVVVVYLYSWSLWLGVAVTAWTLYKIIRTALTPKETA